MGCPGAWGHGVNELQALSLGCLQELQVFQSVVGMAVCCTVFLAVPAVPWIMSLFTAP